MLIFWRLVLAADTELYKQDPTKDELSNEVWNSTSLTRTDKAVNYLVGSFFIIPFLTSTALNPLLAWYFNIKKSKANTLFKVLAISDFFTTLVTPLTYTIIMLDSTLYASSDIALRQVRPLCCLFGCISQVTTCMIAVTRMLQVLAPFIYIRQYAVIAYLVVYTLYMIVNNGTYYVALEFFPQSKSLQKLGLNLCIWPNFAHCLLGIVASTTTMVYLLYKRATIGGVAPRRNWRNCVTICIMNIPYLITMITILNVKLFLPGEVSFREILFAWLPFCLSGLNPVIIIVRMKNVQQFVRVKVMRMFGSDIEWVDASNRGKSPVLQRIKADAVSYRGESPVLQRIIADVVSHRGKSPVLQRIKADVVVVKGNL